MACRHEDCAFECECTCDKCQDIYERHWKQFTNENDLCFACGMPREMTVASLYSTRTVHFYLPCDDCKPAYVENMKAANLCQLCREPLSGLLCVGCTCTEDLATCICRQCKRAREKPDTQ